jgi:hypothetical protein
MSKNLYEFRYIFNGTAYCDYVAARTEKFSKYIFSHRFPYVDINTVKIEKIGTVLL